MHVLIATFNFFPTHFHGTERYIAELVAYCSARMPEVSFGILCSVSISDLEDSEQAYSVLLEHDRGQCVTWVAEGIPVIGVEFSHFDSRANLRFHSEGDTELFSALLHQAAMRSPDMIWFHGGNRTSNLSLTQALPNVPYAVWLHTPFGCPKGTLIRKGQTCTTSIAVANCAPCALLGSKELSAPAALRLSFAAQSRGKAYRKFMSEACHVVAFTESMRSHLLAQGISEDRFQMVQHGTDFQPAENPVGREDDHPIIFGYFGRLDREKGFEFLVETWCTLTDSPEIRQLVLVSKDWEAHPKLERLSLRKDVQLIAPVDRSQVHELYARIDALFVPSMFVETGPLVIHEAMRANVFVLASDHGGCRALAEYYHPAAATAPFGDSEAWIHQILAIDRAQIRTNMARQRNAPPSVNQHFDTLFKNFLWPPLN